MVCGRATRVTHALSVALAVWFHPDLFVERILHHFWPELLGVSLALAGQALIGFYFHFEIAEFMWQLKTP